MTSQSSVTAYDVAIIEGHTKVCEEMEAHGYQSLGPPTEVNTVWSADSI